MEGWQTLLAIDWRMGGTGSMKRTKKINKIRRRKQQPFRATACVSCRACLGDRNGVRRGEKGVCSATGAGCISSRTNSSPLEVSRVLSWRQPSTLTPTSLSPSLSRPSRGFSATISSNPFPLVVYYRCYLDETISDIVVLSFAP